MPHETDRPCLSCHLRQLIEAHRNMFGYSAEDLINHTSAVLADLAASLAIPGREEEAKETLRELMNELVKDSFVREAKARAAETPGPKEPTVSDVGHA